MDDHRGPGPATRTNTRTATGQRRHPAPAAVGDAAAAIPARPGPVLELLDRLKDDGSEYVRRSVANNLNDIAKDNPQVALDVAGRWYEGRERLVKHALRTLLKAGDPQALAILGYSTSSVSARRIAAPHRHRKFAAL